MKGAEGILAVGVMPRIRRIARRRRSLLFLAVAGLGLSAGALVLGGVSRFAGPHRGETAEISLVAQNLRFNETNPPIEMRLGDTLRLVVTNAEAGGIAHDLIIAGPAGLTTNRLQPGETQMVTFAPSRPGVYHYSCSLHPRLMDGQIVVRP